MISTLSLTIVLHMTLPSRPERDSTFSENHSAEILVSWSEPSWPTFIGVAFEHWSKIFRSNFQIAQLKSHLSHPLPSKKAALLISVSFHENNLLPLKIRMFKWSWKKLIETSSTEKEMFRSRTFKGLLPVFYC